MKGYTQLRLLSIFTRDSRMLRAC